MTGKAVFPVIRRCIEIAYPKMEIVGLENLPEGGAVIVGNHAQMYGPLNAELVFPEPRRTWCAAPMMRLKEVPAYAFQDFWGEKPARSRWAFRILSYLIAPLAVCLFNNAATIPVYRDTRLRSTFRESIDRLAAGERIIIFPERNVPYNGILYDFQEHFIDLGRFYHRATGMALPFVPMYSAPRLRKIVLGQPILFDPGAPLAEERRRVRDSLIGEITRLAVELPRHTVVPYRNMPKKDYPENIPQEVQKP